MSINKPVASAAQHAGLRLSLALILGLLVVPAYVVAPVLFNMLDSKAAGEIAGRIFHVSNLGILLLVMAAALFCFRIRVQKSTWYLLGAVALLVAINAFGVSSMMALLKSEAGDISALDKTDPLRLAFAFWHGIGSVMQLVSSLLVAMLVMKSHGPVPAEADKA